MNSLCATVNCCLNQDVLRVLCDCVVNHPFTCEALGSLEERWAVLWTRLFWAVRPLDCWASRGEAKNSSEGRGGAQWDRDRVTEGVRANTGADTEMASKGETFGLERKGDNSGSPSMQTMFRYSFTAVTWMYRVVFDFTERRDAVDSNLNGWRPFVASSSRLTSFVTLLYWWESRTIEGLKVGI